MVTHDHETLSETGLCESGCVFGELRDGRIAEEKAFFLPFIQKGYWCSIRLT